MKTEIKIYYEDTDCGGVVYYANYLRFYERARTEHLAALGLDPKDMVGRDIMFTVVTANSTYLSPARYGDIIIVETAIIEISKASFTFGYKVYNKTTNELLNEGKTKIVLVGPGMKVKKLEPWFHEKLAALPK
jgi:acyl-CoA thioester hydrolase